MKRIESRQLTGRSHLDRIEIISAEGCSYILNIHFEGEPHHLVDHSGKSRRFHSIHEIREILHGKNCADTVLVQDIAYDEMIGHSPEKQSLIETKISLN
ncbi:MAG: DUF6482 family protein [Cellvibrionales bacterium]|nr:DUF6482 family protein [Cellvibrionales bacterium]